MSRRAWSFALLLLALVGSCKDDLPPLGEAIVEVDTDMPVPAVVSRLRVDIYAADTDGRWSESRDIPRVDSADWPVSFSVYNDDIGKSRRVYVRLRAYLDGLVQDYRADQNEELPRLLDAQGVDRTPPSEPLPSAAIDRILLLDLVPGRRGRAHVVLRGDCAGAPADLALRSSCVSDRQADPPLTPAGPENLDADLKKRQSSLVGSWGAAACQPAEASDERICIPGGATIVGTPDLLKGPFVSFLPLRAVRVPKRALDKKEVTVARFRAALAKGFVPPAMPTANEAATLTVPDEPDACSFSQAPRPDREELPVTCLSWETARAFCKFEGGDLPTEAFWEYAASRVGKGTKTDYPWGNEPPPNCEQTNVDRVREGVCGYKGFGPKPVGSMQGDVTPLGLLDMGGNVAEYTRDIFHEDPTACWNMLTNIDPTCLSTSGAIAVDGEITHVVRGGSYEGIARQANAAVRNYTGSYESNRRRAYVGIRCAYDL
jgi:formylglycine-generating enzyme required for sulfatase activity